MASSLSHQILVLNRLWQAVNIVGVRRGFSLLVQCHAKVIYTGDGSFRVLDIDDWIELNERDPLPEDHTDCIHTVRYRLRIPKVLLLGAYDKMPTKDIKFNKQSVFERDHHRCQYCGDTFSEDHLNLDHVIPRDQGGKTSWENIVTSCIYCNSKKANRMPHQANMHILSRPVRPKRRPFVSFKLQDADKEWSYFIPQK